MNASGSYLSVPSGMIGRSRGQCLQEVRSGEAPNEYYFQTGNIPLCKLLPERQENASSSYAKER